MDPTKPQNEGPSRALLSASLDSDHAMFFIDGSGRKTKVQPFTIYHILDVVIETWTLSGENSTSYTLITDGRNRWKVPREHLLGWTISMN